MEDNSKTEDIALDSVVGIIYMYIIRKNIGFCLFVVKNGCPNELIYLNHTR